MAFEMPINDELTLRELYRDPRDGGKRKESPILDDGARTFIESSPFFMFATASDRGADASPRGGPPGFVTVLDEHRLAWGDLAGNNRLDSFRNLLDQPDVALLFLIPGVDETLRVNGTATLTRDPAILERVDIDGRTPNVAVGVDVDVCFIHCAKAFRRAGLWSPDSWLPEDQRPSASKVLIGHMQIDMPAEELADRLEVAYADTMWKAGGALEPT